MFKSAIFAVVLCAMFNTIFCVTDAYSHEDEPKVNLENVGNAGFSKEEFKYDYDEKIQKKKYYKGNNFNKENVFEKNKNYEKRKFISLDKFDISSKNEKYRKHANLHEDSFKIKNINYHDKDKHEDKGKYRSQQDTNENSTLSLHKDINVNYIGNHNVVPKDVEIIKHRNYLEDYKKKGHMKTKDDVTDKKIKPNFYENLKTVDLISIPTSNNSALVARYIIHNVDWTAMATLSTNSKMKGSPFVNVISVSDGPVNKGSGVPFFYMTPKDFTSIDLEKDDRCTITATLAQTGFCKEKKLDPESPLCARIILNGKIKKIKPNTAEEKFAKEALFSRHQEMKNWPADHDWFFSKLKIKQIILLNHFGGASYISTKDYFDA